MKYDSVNYEPPAPIVKVVLFRPISKVSEEGVGKIDTGADMTVIPTSCVERLRLNPASTILVRGYDGREEEVETYFVGIELAGFKFPLVEVMCSNRKDTLIGRDILNRLRVELNGKRLRFELQDP